MINDSSNVLEKEHIKAVIVYLTRSTRKDVTNLKHSLSLLDINFNDIFKYPVVIFHEDFDEKLMEDVRKSTHSDVKFEKVEFEIPDFLDKENIPELIYIEGFEFSIGYRHMCRFFSGPIYKLPVLKNYDYYLRLDTDSFILDKIDYDIFRFMQEKDYIYGHLEMGGDCNDAVIGLSEFAEKYINDNNIHPTFLHKFTQNGFWDGTSFGENFEVSKFDFWRSDRYINFFEDLDKTGGIYKHRWGDAAIHFLAISIFVPEKQVHKFRDIAYQHQNFINPEPIDFESISKLTNMKLEIVRTILKLSTSLKKKSKLYRKCMKLRRDYLENDYKNKI